MIDGIVSLNQLYLHIAITTQKMHRRYDIEANSSRFKEFISHEMAQGHRNGSYVQIPAKKANQGNNKAVSYEEIYSHPQFVRNRRGASVLKSQSKFRERKDNRSMAKLKKDVLDNSLNFYESARSRNMKAKVKQETSSTTGIPMENEIDIEELHYQLVNAQQSAQKRAKHT